MCSTATSTPTARRCPAVRPRSRASGRKRPSSVRCSRVRRRRRPSSCSRACTSSPTSERRRTARRSRSTACCARSPSSRSSRSTARDLSPESDPRAADGRVPGRRGLATRQRLLECTAGMLQSTSYRELTVIDIAREAGTSPATFYQYFSDVEAAILVLAEQMAKDGHRLAVLVRESSWKGKAGLETATLLCDAFFEFWEEYRSILRVMDLATEEGDRRFHQIRTRLLNEVTVALSETIGHFQDDARQAQGPDPTATAAVLVSMLAHVAAHQYGFEFWGIRTKDLRESMARQIYWGVTGKKP